MSAMSATRDRNDARPRALPTMFNETRNEDLQMQLLHEDLARAQLAQRLEEAGRRQRDARLVAALRAERKAEKAAVRARHLRALAANT